MSVNSWALANHQGVLSHHSILELDLVVPKDHSVLVLKAGVANCYLWTLSLASLRLRLLWMRNKELWRSYPTWARCSPPEATALNQVSRGELLEPSGFKRS